MDLSRLQARLVREKSTTSFRGLPSATVASFSNWSPSGIKTD